MELRPIAACLILYLICHQNIGQTRKDVTTPKGSNVRAYELPELLINDRQYLDALYSSSNRTYIYNFSGQPSSSGRFNCHGYAWNMSEGGPVRWIGRDVNTDENIYMTDGSYVQVCNEIYPGKVSWGSVDHSAITTSTPGRWIYMPVFYPDASRKNLFSLI